MASGIYTAVNTAKWKGDIDIDTHSLKCALLANTYTFNPDHDGWADVSAHEITGAGYTAGGQVLTGVVATSEDSLNLSKLDYNDPVWTSSSITARYSVVYSDTHAGKCLIECRDFGADRTSTDGTFTININAAGAITES